MITFTWILLFIYNKKLEKIICLENEGFLYLQAIQYFISLLIPANHQNLIE